MANAIITDTSYTRFEYVSDGGEKFEIVCRNAFANFNGLSVASIRLPNRPRFFLPRYIVFYNPDSEKPYYQTRKMIVSIDKWQTYMKYGKIMSVDMLDGVNWNVLYSVQERNNNLRV